MGDGEKLTFSLGTVVKVVLFVGAVAGSYFGGIATADSRMRAVAREVVEQKQETFNVRLSAIERKQDQMDLKIDRMLEAVIERNRPRRAGSGLE